MVQIEYCMQRKIVKGFILDEDIKIPVIEYIEVTNNYVKLFECIEDKLAVLNRIDIMLIYYLARTAEGTIISSNIKTRTSFIESVKRRTKLEYTDGSVTQSFAHLKKESILLSIKGNKGMYYINPMFVYVGLERERKQLLNDIDIEEYDKENLILREQREQLKLKQEAI